MERATRNGEDVRGRRLLIWLGFWAMAFCAAQLLRGLPLANGAAVSGDSPARLLCAYAAWLLALVAVLLAVAFPRLPRTVADVVDSALMLRATPFPLLAVCTAHLLRALAEAADRKVLVDSSAAAAAGLVGAYGAWLLVLVATLAPVDGAPTMAVPSSTIRSWVWRPILEGRARGATSNGDDVLSSRLLIRVGFSAMALWAAQMLRGLPLAQGTAVGGDSPARLLCAYAAWLLALVAVLLAVAFPRLPKTVADVVDYALMLRAAPFPLLAVCTAHLLRALAEAADREALVDSTAAAAGLVGAYGAWLLMLVFTLAPIAGVPPRSVPSTTLMLLSAVIWCLPLVSRFPAQNHRLSEDFQIEKK